MRTAVIPAGAVEWPLEKAPAGSPRAPPVAARLRLDRNHLAVEGRAQFVRGGRAGAAARGFEGDVLDNEVDGAHLHVALSLVVRLNVVWVVPAGRLPAGASNVVNSLGAPSCPLAPTQEPLA